MSHPLIYDSDGLDYREGFSISDNDEYWEKAVEEKRGHRQADRANQKQSVGSLTAHLPLSEHCGNL